MALNTNPQILYLASGFLLTLTACDAVLQGPGSAGSEGMTDGAPHVDGQEDLDPGLAEGENLSTAAAFTCNPKLVTAAAPRLWRLTSRQFKNSVEAFLGGRRDQDGGPAEYEGPLPFEVVSDSARFSTSSALYAMTTFDFTGAVTATESAARTLGDGGLCVNAEDLGECLRGELTTRAALALRRPITNEELDQYVQVASAAAPVLGAAEAVTLALQAVLLTPEHLFRAELGRGPVVEEGIKSLDPFEVAAALSFTLTDEPPSAMTLALAESGELLLPGRLAAEAERLASAPEFKEKLGLFVEEYTHFGDAAEVFKDPAVAPEHDGVGLVLDTRAWVSHLLDTKGADGFLAALYSEASGFISPSTASTYGLSAPGERSLVEFDPQERAGILSHPSWLVAFSHTEENMVVQRGNFVFTELLCQPGATAPPADIPPLPALGDDVTLREKLRIHTESPACASCHQWMDPIGLGFEGYDHLGQFRTMEAGVAANSTGELPGDSPDAGPFSGAPELGQKLAQSEDAARCYLRYSFRFWLGRDESAADGCSLLDTLETSDKAGNVIAATTSLFSSTSFLHRNISE